MAKWIRADKQLPPYDQQVLVCTVDHEVVIGHLERPSWKSDQAIRGSGKVLCWQPLDLDLKPIVKPKKIEIPEHLKIIK